MHYLAAICVILNVLFINNIMHLFQVWDLANLQCLHTLRAPTSAVMSVLCWDRCLLSSSLDNTIKVRCGMDFCSLLSKGTSHILIYHCERRYGVYLGKE